MKKLTKSLDKIIQTSGEIISTPESEFVQHISFLHTVFCQVGLPRSKVNGTEFVRRNGNAWLSIQSGFIDEGNGPVLQPIPYGSMPRLAMAYITTYAVRHRTREIPLECSASQFLKSLDLSNDGRRYKTLRAQMHALASCRLQLGYKGRTYNGQPIDKFNAWLIDGNSDYQYSLWPGSVTLSEPFYGSLLDAPVPLDIRALFALKQSSLAMDIYTWLAHRLYRIPDEDIFLPWAAIRKQFGMEFTGKTAHKDFKNEFKYQFAKARAVYPNAKADTVKGGLLLSKSEPPIPFRPQMLENISHDIGVETD